VAAWTILLVQPLQQHLPEACCSPLGLQCKHSSIAMVSDMCSTSTAAREQQFVLLQIIS
jgi:hypothetical protein